jgi:hypothetical protein
MGSALGREVEFEKGVDFSLTKELLRQLLNLFIYYSCLMLSFSIPF